MPAKTASEIRANMLSKIGTDLGVSLDIYPDSALVYLITMVSEQLGAAYIETSLISSGVSSDNNLIPEIVDERAAMFGYTVRDGRPSSLVISLTAGTGRLYVNQGAIIKVVDSDVVTYWNAADSYVIEPTETLECIFNYTEDGDTFVDITVATFDTVSGFSGEVDAYVFESISVGYLQETLEETAKALYDRAMLNTFISSDAICEAIRVAAGLDTFTVIENNSAASLTVGAITISPWKVAFMAHPSTIAIEQESRIIAMLYNLLPIGVQVQIPANSTEGVYHTSYGIAGREISLGYYFVQTVTINVEITVITYKAKATGEFYTEAEVKSAARKTLNAYIANINTNADPIFRTLKAASNLMQDPGINECTIRIDTGGGFTSSNYTKASLTVLTLGTVTYV